jgi:sulfur carrier protein
MRVSVNGKDVVFEVPVSVEALVEHQGATRRGSAVAVDGAVVPRSKWAEFMIEDGQHIELLTAVPGG